jgi:glycerophosphoryl diester phosphodiesterase
MSDYSNWVKTAPLVIAHRGASAYAPENTLAAFRLATSLQADAIELDAKLLNDGTIIVLHDNTLDRTTDGSGSVYDYSYEEVRKLDAGSHFSSEFSDEWIPTLEEVFQAVGEKLLINVEMTNYVKPLDRLPHRTISMVHEYGLVDRILLSSFNPWALIVAKRIDPSIPRALLVGAGEPKIIRNVLKMIVDHAFFHPRESLVTATEVRKLKGKKRINVWTVNDQARMMELFSMGVDGLITDFPDMAREALRRSAYSSNGNHRVYN